MVLAAVPIRKMMQILLLIWTTCVGITMSQDQCRTPHGDAGVCLLLQNCKPLKELNEKEDQTKEELMFMRQASCGLHLNLKPKVCCPPEYQWNDFRVLRPVNFPTGRPQLVPSAKPTTERPTLLTPIHRPAIEAYGNNCPVSVQPPDPDSFCCGIEVATNERITGGKAASPDQYPWLALLEYDKTKLTHCGGSLISSRYVLTAAHCLETQHGKPHQVRLAEYNTSSYPTDIVDSFGGGQEVVTVVEIKVSRAIPHPNYKPDVNRQHDIGLLRLVKDAPYTDFIRPICLPIRDVVNEENLKFYFIAAGWGNVGPATPSEIKLQVNLPFVPLDECQKPYSSHVNKIKIRDTQICAGGVKGHDTCGGDSGGPLMYVMGNAFVISGIVSYGHVHCGTEGVPGVYTNVYKYKDWIMKNAV